MAEIRLSLSQVRWIMDEAPFARRQAEKVFHREVGIGRGKRPDWRLFLNRKKRNFLEIVVDAVETVENRGLFRKSLFFLFWSDCGKTKRFSTEKFPFRGNAEFSHFIHSSFPVEMWKKERPKKEPAGGL